MYARMHTLATTPEHHDRGEELVLGEILPWLRDSTGFRGLIRFAAPDRSKVLLVTLWADEDAFRKSAEAGRSLGELTATAVGSKRLALEDYEVTFFDVDITSGERPS
jgi:heme-degrading monooxygenase HmoA